MIIILDEGAIAYGDVSDSDLAVKLKKSHSRKIISLHPLLTLQDLSFS